MNIFVTDEDPRKCAEALDDKRVGKLLMEANQMLSLAIKAHTTSEFWSTLVGPGRLCGGLAHLNHPCSIWARQTVSNFRWLLDHALALSSEWTHRFGTFHESGNRTGFIQSLDYVIPSGSLTPFQNSARNLGLMVDFTEYPVPYSYRYYLMHRWINDKRSPVWTNRGQPEWSRSCEFTQD